ncbi:TPA: hypothetical protein DEO28_03550 [Candidatus Dependentiae bacterium]|nr:hypothetical protein [Candidatus Dependentiae bacterium]HBZ73556.1 hypothetical protein [Candidatus Dependentiae bacterium]
MTQANIPMEQGLLQKVTDIPSKILLHHEVQNLPQILLHYLGHEDCFGLKHAAYFVDNPDFDHLIGVAGYSNQDHCSKAAEDLWKDPNSFHEAITNLDFNKKVRSYFQDSLKRKNSADHDSVLVHKIAKDIGIENPQMFSWNVKHGNHGLFIFEPKSELSDFSKSLLKNSAMLLGFCAII